MRDNEEKCNWCGEIFIKTHHSQKYCSDDCRTNARAEQSRMKAHRWYHRHKHELSEKSRWGLGSGYLGKHAYNNFDKELKSIQNEFKRLKLKRN